jgi:hypothetical protein
VYHGFAMDVEILDFTATGSPKTVSDAVEQYAASQANLKAIVVPWESDLITLSMAVTTSTGNGWAIEHINLGTIKLSDVGNDLTRVSIVAHEPDHVEKHKMTALFDKFARQIQSKFQIAR